VESAAAGIGWRTLP